MSEANVVDSSGWLEYLADSVAALLTSIRHRHRYHRQHEKAVIIRGRVQPYPQRAVDFPPKGQTKDNASYADGAQHREPRPEGGRGGVAK